MLRGRDVTGGKYGDGSSPAPVLRTLAERDSGLHAGPSGGGCAKRFTSCDAYSGSSGRSFASVSSGDIAPLLLAPIAPGDGACCRCGEGTRCERGDGRNPPICRTGLSEIVPGACGRTMPRGPVDRRRRTGVSADWLRAIDTGAGVSCARGNSARLTDACTCASIAKRHRLLRVGRQGRTAHAAQP